jgi:hypothetical protein
MSLYKKGLDGLTEPSLAPEHDEKIGDLHNFVVRAFTWESKPEEFVALETIEKMVEEFLEEYLAPAEVIIARTISYFLICLTTLTEFFGF